MSGTIRELLFRSKSRCFASKNHKWGLGPIETSNSDARHAVLYAVLNAKNNRWRLGPIETCNSGPKVAVLHAKTTDEGWDPLRLVILMLITLFCMHNMTGEVWDPWRLVFLFQSRCFDCKNHKWVLGPIETSNSDANHVFFCMHKTTGEVWNPWRLVILIQNLLFWMQKSQMRVGTNRDLQIWC